jgi:hypothetical protein
LVWKRQTRAAAITAPLVGMSAGLAVWIGTAYGLYGAATITTLGQTLPCMYGCLTSSFVPLPVTVAISYLWPNPNFEWSDLLAIKRVEDDDHGRLAARASHFDQAAYFAPERVAYMKRMSKIAVIWGVATFAGQVALWPLPMYGARMIFSKGVSFLLLVRGSIHLTNVRAASSSSPGSSWPCSGFGSPSSSPTSTR